MTNNSGGKSKLRFNRFTKSSLQHKYLGLILLSILLPLFIVGGCLYYVMFQVMAEQLAIPESIAHNLIPVLHRINFLLLVSMPPIIILLIVWGASLTHRFLGPLSRLEEDIRKISEGDYSVRISLRKDDDLAPVGKVMNQIIDKLEKSEASG